jgi:hypothetical protein
LFNTNHSKFNVLLFDEFALVFDKLFPKSTVWVHASSSTSHELQSSLESNASLPHEIGNGKTSTSGYSSSAVKQYLSLLCLHLLHPLVELFKILLDWLTWEIIQF